MEDDKGLELSLALPSGGDGSSHKDKDKIGSSSNSRTSDSDRESKLGDRDSKLIDEFKNFLEGGSHQHLVKSEEKALNNFSRIAADIQTYKQHNSGVWASSNDSRSSEVEEQKRTDVGDKRKSLFNEMNQQKRHEKEEIHDLTEKSRQSHISINTDDGSTAENEDVADSEVDGSTSRLIPHHDDVSKGLGRTGGPSRTHKEIHTVTDSSSIERLGPKRFTITSEKEITAGNLSVPYGVSFPAQTINMINMSYSQPLKDPKPTGTPNSSSYPLPGMIQSISGGNSERSGTHSPMAANLPFMFGYNPVQLPALDRGNSQGLVSHHQQLRPSYAGWDPGNSDKHHDSLKISQGTLPVILQSSSGSVQAAERGANIGRQHPGEEASSSRTEGDLKGNNTVHQVKDVPDQPRSEAFPSEFPAIRPGIASDLKFGGSGSYPNLPWVSTTAPGPNGRTISGVTYRYSPTHIKIVCACHGTHLSPEEFVRHAGEEHGSTGGGLVSLPNNNPAASAQS